MKTQNHISFLLAAIIAISVASFLAACGTDSKGSVEDLPAVQANEEIAQIVESSFTTSVTPPVDVTYASATEADEAMLVPADDSSPLLDPVGGIIDAVKIDQTVYALVSEGVLIHDLTSGDNLLIPTLFKPGAIIAIGEKVFVGGDNLYTLVGDQLTTEDFDLDLDGEITAIHVDGQTMYLGTTSGLYEVGLNGVRKLAEEIHVTALASGSNGLWVGTAGDGLFFRYGENFDKRFLRRDTTLFDNVTALQYSHNHLYLGTNKGLFVYDGGRWQSFDLADGLPSERIRSINADEWIIKIGTDNGAVTFFEGQFNLIKNFEGLAVSTFIDGGRSLIAGTINCGMVKNSGGLMTVLYDGGSLTTAMTGEGGL